MFNKSTKKLNKPYYFLIKIKIDFNNLINPKLIFLNKSFNFMIFSKYKLILN